MNRPPLLTALASALAIAVAAHAGDWPAYRHDVQRSAVTDEELSFPLAPAWTYTCAQPPAPAWGEQLNLVNRVDYDYAPGLAIADGIVCFGSSADDTVRALDAETGRERWRYTAGGPVRIAPQIAGGRVFFSADDGMIYCLDAATGAPVWTFRAAPADERMVINHRMVSRWPGRTGVLVADGVAYCSAGIWNTEGVFVYALEADTGRVIWCNDRIGYGSMGLTDFVGLGINGQHQGEFGMSGASPQGPMAADDRVLVIPSGFSGPSQLDRRTGGAPTRGGGGGGPAGTGGTWVTIDGSNLYTFAIHGQGGNVLLVAPYSLTGGQNGRPWGAGAVPQLSVGPQLKPGEIHEKGKVSVIVNRGQLYARKACGIAKAGGTLLLGQDNAVVAERANLLTAAEIRFGAAGEDLLVHAVVRDRKVVREATPWKGSCVEIFGAMPGAAPIGQVFLLPAAGSEPAAAFRPEGGRAVPAPEIRIRSAPTPDGYEISALIPIPALALARTNGSWLLEAQVTTTGPDGTAQRDTLFGSASAYQDSSRFGAFRLKPQAALSSPEPVRTLLAAAKPGIIRLRASGELWQSAVFGQAREMAVANGRLYVATDRGVIHCFGAPGGGAVQPAVAHDPGAAIRAAAPPAIPESAARLAERTHDARVDRGFALVLGDPDAQVSAALATRTRLRIVTVLTNAAAANALRSRLIERTTWYGTRIHVQTVDRLDRLPFAGLFANAVVVAGPVPGLSMEELYRVLHPCGGTLFAPALQPAELAALATAAGVPESEIRLGPDDARIVRGKLPGALDWDSKDIAADQRVKWPMRPLWIGGPSTLQIRNYRQGADGPAAGGGRYFIKSETALTAVDAYNGAILWTRPIPREWPDLRCVDGALYAASETNAPGRDDRGRFIRITDDFVYLRLGKGYLRGRDQAYAQLDARTGEQVKFYGPFETPEAIALTAPRSWPVPLDATHSGVVGLEQTADALVVTLTTRDPSVTTLDAWDLFFDFRPPEQRYGLYGRGTFCVRVSMPPDARTPPAWSPGADADCPPVQAAGQRAADGTRVVVKLPWPGLQALAGCRPASFGFAATLNSHDGQPDTPVVRRHLFGDWAADGINNGWAAVSLDGSAAAKPAVIAGLARDMKDRTGYVGAGGRELAPAVADAQRVHPLTGELGPKVYRPSTLCGASFFSSDVMSGRAGMYDAADDSGTRFVNAVKSRCTSPQTVGLGLIIISEETGHCSCNYPIRSSVAFAPAERRLNEDWAVFHDRAADTRVRQAAINLGAPGDRRDDGGTLWLGFPRPPADKGVGYSLAAGKQHAVTAPGVWMRFIASALPVPLDIECFGGTNAYRSEEDSQTFWNWSTRWIPNRLARELGPRRVNADRVPIAGTGRPWIYASNYRGIRKATLQLSFLQPLASRACDAPPAVDGATADAAWAGGPQARLPFTQTDVFLRHDSGHLYVAARRPPVIDRLGQTAAWTQTATGHDAAVWADDSWEVFLADADATRVLHLGVSASGARYDALAAGTNREDAAWDGEWAAASAADTNGLAFEMAIPIRTLAAAGLDASRLGLNVQINQKNVSGEALKYPGYIGRDYSGRTTSGEALCSLGPRGRVRCMNVIPLGLGAAPAAPDRAFTVRLHFAELDDVSPGQRVFDVKVQGQTVIRGLDVAREAGARTALVKEFAHVRAGDSLVVEFEPADPSPTPATAPILNGLEVYDESFQRPRGAGAR